MTTDTLSTGTLRSQFNELKHSFEDTPYLPIEQRLALLKQVRAKIVTLEQDLIAAVSKDFGYRTAFDRSLALFICRIAHHMRLKVWETVRRSCVRTWSIVQDR